MMGVHLKTNLEYTEKTRVVAVAGYYLTIDIRMKQYNSKGYNRDVQVPTILS